MVSNISYKARGHPSGAPYVTLSLIKKHKTCLANNSSLLHANVHSGAWSLVGLVRWWKKEFERMKKVFSDNGLDFLSLSPFSLVGAHVLVFALCQLWVESVCGIGNVCDRESVCLRKREREWDGRVIGVSVCERQKEK